jgi:apolipoprotein N-acyltransferase
MASKSENALLCVLATALSALGWWFGSGLQPLWWLTWMAPLPVFWLAPRVGAMRIALVAFAAYAAGGFNQWSYMHQTIGLPLPQIACFIAIPALILVACTLLFRSLLLRGHALMATLAVPTTWVALEYIYSLVSPHATFGNISYTQMDALAIIQVAALAGIWGIGFLLLLMPATVAVMTTRYGSLRGRRFAVTFTVVSIVLALAYGGWRLRTPATATMRIGLASLEKPFGTALQKAEGQALEMRYAEVAARLVQQGAGIVLFRRQRSRRPRKPSLRSRNWRNNTT